MLPEIGAYLGEAFPSQVHPKIHTPNIDAPVERSLLLKRAYVQQALRSPSRTSLLTGRRPDTTQVYNQGLLTERVGKLYHYTTVLQTKRLRDDRHLVKYTTPPSTTTYRSLGPRPICIACRALKSGTAAGIQCQAAC